MDANPDLTSCQVVALVPRGPDSGSVLCETSSSELLLPVVKVEAEPTTSSVLRSIEARLGMPTTLLRANAVSWHENWDAAAMFVEVGPVEGDPAPGLQWTPLAEADVVGVLPRWARPSIAGWLRERSDGWDPRRPQWSRPGWAAEAGAWMTDEMRRAGYREPQTPRIHHLWGVTAVLVAESLDGRAYLKASGDRFRHEGEVTRALAASSPGRLPDLLAVERERGWMLMRDFGSTELGEQPAARWGIGLEALADLQLQWLGRGSELLALGAELRPLDVLASWVEATKDDDDLLGQLPPGERAHWLKSLEYFVASCESLADITPELTLVHGDFHPWNVALSDGRALIFDWTDASLTHPFLDLATYVMRTREAGPRDSMVSEYLDRWRQHLPDPVGPEIVELCLVVGALHQAHTYSQLIPTVMPEDLSHLRGGDAEWLQRALRFRDQSLRAVY